MFFQSYSLLAFTSFTASLLFLFLFLPLLLFFSLSPLSVLRSTTVNISRSHTRNTLRRNPLFSLLHLYVQDDFPTLVAQV
jgi:hypothetical protein